jgi:F-type H+-transporting ATPase subunit epsilon
LANLQLDIVTAERLMYSEEVQSVVAPGTAGELGILPSHAPLLTSLAPGELRVTRDGDQTAIVVSGGFLEVIGGHVTVLADTAEQADDIDVERAEAALKRAEEGVASADTQMDLARAVAAMHRSRARIAVAGRRRRRTARGEAASQK